MIWLFGREGGSAGVSSRWKETLRAWRAGLVPGVLEVYSERRIQAVWAHSRADRKMNEDLQEKAESGLSQRRRRCRCFGTCCVVTGVNLVVLPSSTPTYKELLVIRSWKISVRVSGCTQIWALEYPPPVFFLVSLQKSNPGWRQVQGTAGAAWHPAEKLLSLTFLSLPLSTHSLSGCWGERSQTAIKTT